MHLLAILILGVSVRLEPINVSDADKWPMYRIIEALDDIYKNPDDGNYSSRRESFPKERRKVNEYIL